MRLGIDLDNTLIFYDDAFAHAAIRRGLLPDGFRGSKQALRDALRAQPNGEEAWQALQGYVYGAGLEQASLFPGAEDFLKAAAGHELFIISHKTEFGHFDPAQVNLRQAARNFLQQRGMLAHVPGQNLIFAATRAEKAAAIAKVAPAWFIDDLPEVFEEPAFPKATRRILFHPHPAPAPAGDWLSCTSWKAIQNTILAQ